MSNSTDIVFHHRWRAALREKHRGASEARAELLKLGITDDPNDP